MTNLKGKAWYGLSCKIYLTKDISADGLNIKIAKALGKVFNQVGYVDKLKLSSSDSAQ